MTDTNQVGTGSAGAPGAAAGAAQAQAGGPGTTSGQVGNSAAAQGDARFYTPLNPSKEAAEYADGKGWKSFDEVTKSYRELEGRINAKGVIVPGENATAQELDAFHTALGRPAKAEAYEIAPPSADFKPTDTDKLFHGEMQKAAFEAGLTPKQWARLNNGYNGVYQKAMERVAEMQAEHAKAGQKAIETLEGEWRKQGVDATKAKALAQTAAQTLIPKDSPLWAQLEPALEIKGQPGSGAAAIIDLFHRIGTMMSESGGVLRPSAGAAGHAALTAPQAQIELDRMKADPNVRNILNDKLHANYKATLEKWNGLIETIDRAAAQKARAA